jgi:hypothetical protein
MCPWLQKLDFVGWKDIINFGLINVVLFRIMKLVGWKDTEVRDSVPVNGVVRVEPLRDHQCR